MEQQQISLQQIYAKLIELERAIKKFDKVDKYIEELEFARRTEEAWQEIDEGKGKTYSLAEFRKKLKN